MSGLCNYVISLETVHIILPETFMTNNPRAWMMFGRKWEEDFDKHAHELEVFNSLADAEMFIKNNLPLFWAAHFDFFITEFTWSVYIPTNSVTFSLGNRVKYILPTASNIATTGATTTDDIDYSKPGEALKAHKAGKKVDWKKVAEYI